MIYALLTTAWLVGATDTISAADDHNNYSATREEATYLAYSATSLHITGLSNEHDGGYTFRGMKNDKPVWGKDERNSPTRALRVGWLTPKSQIDDSCGYTLDTRRSGWAVYVTRSDGTRPNIIQHQDPLQYVPFGSWQDQQETMFPPARARYLRFTGGPEVGFTDCVRIEIRRSGEALSTAASVLPEVFLRHAIPLELTRGLLSHQDPIPLPVTRGILSRNLPPLHIGEPASRTPTIDATALQRYSDEMMGQMQARYMAELDMFRASLAVLSSSSHVAHPEASHETGEMAESYVGSIDMRLHDVSEPDFSDPHLSAAYLMLI